MSRLRRTLVLLAVGCSVVIAALDVRAEDVGQVAHAVAPGGPLHSIAIPDCTLIDDNAAYNDADTTRTQAVRIGMISGELRAQLASRGLYRVADNTPAAPLIARLQSSQDLNACNGCEREIGRALGVERVGLCWVQKISNLILNINLRVEDVASGKTLFQRSVDMRGNTDQSWRRASKSLLDLLEADKDAQSR
ncbi:DUF3280 domain-containing protein [Paraburkholderia sp.]|uniref:DUF3280 domain-containing protein n=1 Tax=Paraburkholderia sp. TaxID=1926495 RepID=UPI0023960861|nr:DUF3280 domain-containing protein [Paraburkholderia sp.]MDE1179184.1 DUF3280 domain-containing protein [Paraburkholderia sp.]